MQIFGLQTKIFKLTFRLLKVCWKISKKHSLISLVAILAISSLPYISIYIVNLLIDIFIVSDVNEGRLILLLTLLILAMYITSIGEDVYNFARESLSMLLGKYFNKEVNTVLAMLPIPQIENPEFVNFMERVKRSYSNRPQSFFNMLLELIRGTVELIAGFVIFVTLGFGWALILILSFVPYVLTNLYLGKKQYELYLKNTETERKIGHVAWMFTFKPALKELKAYRAEPFFVNKVLGFLDEILIRTHSLLRERFILNSIFQIFPVLASLGIVLSVVANVKQGTVAVGLLALYFFTTQRFLMVLSSYSKNIAFLYESGIFLQDIFNLIDMRVGLDNKEKAKIQLKITQPPTIEFKDVYFNYPETEKHVLQGINFKILPGEKIAIIGENGAGKSTIVNLLLKIYEPSQGGIYVNNIALSKIDNKSWYKVVAYMMQELTSYNFTVKEFVTLSKNFDKKRLTNALEWSQASRIVESFSQGWDQQLGKYYSNGVDLSGGQWQRLTLARVLYKDSLFYILDEPTSAIDPKAEADIFVNLERVLDDRTLIYISHRFTTIRKADRILYVGNGKIIGDGTHQELMLSSSSYKEIFDAQAKSFI